jgi:hypothetical protein
MALSKIEVPSLDVGQLGSRNVVMNGNFEVNQRSVSSYTGLTGFNRGPDRWMWAKNDTVNFDAVYGTFSNTFTDIPEARGFMEFTLNSAGSGTDFVTIQQRIEDVRVCAGEEVTLTFWARSNTGSSFTLTEAASISHGPIAVQQIFGSGGSGAVNHVVASSITLNTAWTKYSYTFTMPSVSGKTLGTSHHTRLYLCTMMDSDAGKGVQIAQVQMERGKATPFEHENYGTTLQKCQRYFEKSYNQAVSPGTLTNDGMVMFISNRNPGSPHMGLRFIATKRAPPSVVVYNPVETANTLRNLDAGGVSYNSTVNRIGATGCTVYTATSVSLGNFMCYHYTADAEL